ncbi:hypothetical protein O6H91_01G030100 [Diphasiastrum complanatum]|uniref:Uncharacterized protein n=1 Tax=Diphasiastrum complanatum TaxID=34168 RepID=A0ACC2EPG9_DIPCM|nr:hypothetical protein O6H91_01G030100 [Diphasiastrum complanatum]
MQRGESKFCSFLNFKVANSGMDINTMSTKIMNLMALVWSHPILTCCVLLLLSPPLFHIFVYFSPLLISTSLFVVALISIKPHFEETIKEHNAQIPMTSESGVEIDQEEHSQCKRMCDKPMGSKEDLPWFHWVKVAEGVGRSWVETHLKVECTSGFCEVNAFPSSHTTAGAIEPVQVENEELEKELESNDRPMAVATDLSPINLIQESEAKSHQNLESLPEELAPANDSECLAEAESKPDHKAVEEERTLI